MSTRLFSRRHRRSIYIHLLVRGCFLIADLLFLLPLAAAAIISRVANRPFDVGLGPIPLINNKYHKQALELYGYRAETFVDSLWHVTQDFDYTAIAGKPLIVRAFAPYFLFLRCVVRYRSVYVYFCGGPLRLTTLLSRLEPILFQLANVRTVVMPFGSDVNVLTRSNNLLFKHGISQDYPGMRLEREHTAKLIDAWTKAGDFIIGGCDWVDFLYHWDKLMLAHFSIDTGQWPFVGVRDDIEDTTTPLRVLHAPNHRNLKGTAHIEAAIEELRGEGVAIELVVAEGVSNDAMREMLADTDIVVDQLIIGAYAMFALEAMATGKPTVCHIREDLERLFVGAGLVKKGEIPLIDADVLSIKDVLFKCAKDRSKLPEISRVSRSFVENHHSIERIGAQFDEINREIGIPANGKRSPGLKTTA